MNIEIIAGSPRRGSLSHRVALHLLGKLQQQAAQHHVGLINMQEVQLPFVQSVWQTPEHIPAEFKEVAMRIFDASAIIIVSPEYNGGYSPAMKNFLDHFPKQSRKAFGVATSSPGAMGGMRAAQQILQLVPALMGIASPTLLVVPGVDKKFGEDGNLLDEDFAKNINTFIAEFLWLAEAIDKR
jgi:NAD(P)H-dependent FMN reductase